MTAPVEREPSALQIISDTLESTGIEFKKYEVNAYYDQMAAEYEGQCWESPVGSDEARRNFAGTVDNFLSSSTWEMGSIGLGGAGSFAAYLNGGKRCPQSSPYRRVGHLHMGFDAQREKITRNANQVDTQWQTNLKHLGITNDNDARALENALAGRLGRLSSDLKGKRLDNGKIHILEELLKILVDPDHSYLGYKILSVSLPSKNESIFDLKLLGSMVLSADLDPNVFELVASSSTKSPHEMFIIDQLVKRWAYSAPKTKPYFEKLISVVQSHPLGKVGFLLLMRAFFDVQDVESIDRNISDHEIRSFKEDADYNKEWIDLLKSKLDTQRSEADKILVLLENEQLLDLIEAEPSSFNKILPILNSGLAAAREFFRFYGAWLTPGGENKIYNPADWPNVVSKGVDSTSTDMPIPEGYELEDILNDLPDNDDSGKGGVGGASGAPQTGSIPPAESVPPASQDNMPSQATDEIVYEASINRFWKLNIETTAVAGIVNGGVQSVNVLTASHMTMPHMVQLHAVRNMTSITRFTMARTVGPRMFVPMYL